VISRQSSTNSSRLSWLCGVVFPGQAEDADFLRVLAITQVLPYPVFPGWHQQCHYQAANGV
jgi:hypothetical protein